MNNPPKLAIVTTTINQPTKALYKYIKLAASNDWRLIIVGDKKTPHGAYKNLQKQYPHTLRYVSPDEQEEISRELSDLIGWNCIQRRNFGFIVALRLGAEILATVDDDNIPYDNWGQFLAIGNEPQIAVHQSPEIVFDPLSVTTNSRLWHRGFPLEFLGTRHRTKYLSHLKRPRVLVQADLWDGEPDVDAICRIAKGPFDVQFPEEPFAGTAPGPFNSQNTFLHKDVFPTYFLFPHVGRMDDIWASYVTQAAFPDSVVYGSASVYQERNDHNLVTDLKNELIGYENNLELVQSLYVDHSDAWQQLLPEKALAAYEVFKQVILTIPPILKAKKTTRPITDLNSLPKIS